MEIKRIYEALIILDQRGLKKAFFKIKEKQKNYTNQAIFCPQK